MLPPPAIENASWSGLLAWGTRSSTGSFDEVTGAWNQPSVVASASPQYADTWVGIDGLDGSLLQAGTTAWTHGGAVSYAAWFVAWTGAPTGMTVIDEPVASGDRMKVSIDRHGSGMWRVALTDATAGWTWATTVAYPAAGSSAEWIEEAPGTWSTSTAHQALADYGTTTFTTVRANGRAPAPVTVYEIVHHGTVVSYPLTYDPALASFTMHYRMPTSTSAAGSAASRPAPERTGGNHATLIAGGRRRAVGRP